MAYEYKTTIHTMEIKVHTTETHKAFIQRNGSKYFLRDIKAHGNGTYTMIVNPHKYNGVDAEGRYQFQYIPLNAHKEIINQIKEDLQVDSLTVCRLDLCVDPQIDYNYSEKALRLIVLLLANETGAKNRYISYDPLTMETKTIRAEALIGYNGRTYNGALQVEHYNRVLLDQSNCNISVLNRLELRASGTEAGENHGIEEIIKRWETRLNTISDPLVMPERVKAIEDALNSALIERWQQLAMLNGEKPTGKAFNDFVYYNLGNIFTRRQMINLFKLYGDTDQQARDRNKNIRRLGRKTFRGQLMTEKQLSEEIKSIILSIDHFSQL